MSSWVYLLVVIIEDYCDLNKEHFFNDERCSCYFEKIGRQKVHQNANSVCKVHQCKMPISSVCILDKV